MKYGHFDDARNEYVITRPDTPLPWINYLGSEDFFGLISNTGGGYAFYKDARLRRLTRYRYNNIPTDTGGRMIYLRDNASGSYWCPAWGPVRADLDSYECRHGAGYTTITSEKNGVKAEIRFFVPQGKAMEIWQVCVTNTTDASADLSLFSAVEFALWDAWDDATNFQRNLNIGEVEVHDSVIIHKTEYRERRDHIAYFACSEEIDGFDTARDAFLGPYHGWHEPTVVQQGTSTDSIAHGWAPIGSHHVRLALKSGETREMIFLLGYHENPRDARFDPPGSQNVNLQTVMPVIKRFTQYDEVEAAFEALGTYWDDLLGKLQVTTPDEHTNRMVNMWNAYQCMVTFNLSRSASYFESGIGRGMGFRDSNQDLLGFVHMLPGRARERLIDLASTQLESGGAYHQYQPLTKRGNDAVGGGFNDDPMWLVLAVTAYIKETGDFSILDEPVPFDNQPGSEAPMREHLVRALGYTMDNIGPHGLPLIGRADWNDCLNLNTFSEEPGESFQTASHREGGVAESVFIAGLFVLAAREMAALLDHVEGAADQATAYRQQAADMEAVVLEHGWDGAWFRRAYDHYGQVIGSAECDEGQIFIEPQGICVMAGIGTEDGKAIKALDSVDARLATEHGIVLHQPAYTAYRLEMGEITSYPPGYKENAGIFCHTNPWIMAGEAAVGRGDKAFDYYSRINPSAREAISDVHRSEPYVYAQMIAGRDAATHGEAKNSWLTGTAAWNYVAITQYILGIHPGYDGLRLEPRVPAGWDGFTAERVFRGVTYRIDVTRSGPGNAVSIAVDGNPVTGSVVPAAEPGSGEVQVSVTLG